MTALTLLFILLAVVLFLRMKRLEDLWARRPDGGGDGLETRLRLLEGRVHRLETRLAQGGETRVVSLPEEVAEPEPPAPAVPEVTAPRIPEPAPAPAIAAVPPPVREAPAAPPPPVAAPPSATAAVPPSQPAAHPAPSLEERLGARLPVWIGSIAFALAGAFLVKYSFDQGWIGPAVRVVLGVLFGLALLAGGEWLRRSSRYVAQGLAAAGIAVLFAAFLAAVHLYALLPAGLGFALMAATTALAVFLSLRHGPMVAVIGLVGGFLTPALIQPGPATPAGLFGYLFLLQAALLIVSGRRRWTGIALATVAGGFAWVVAWMAGGGDGPSAWPGLFLLASTAVAITGRPGGPGGRPALGPVVAALSLTGSLLLLTGLTGLFGYGTLDWLFLGLLAAGTMVLGRLDSRFFGLAPLAALLVLVLLGTWIPALQITQLPRFVAITAVFGLLFAGGSYLSLQRAPRPARWAALAAASGLLYPLLAFAAGAAVEARLPEAGACGALALVYALAAVPVARKRQRSAEHETALELLAGAAAILVVLVPAFALDGRWLTLAWAAELVVLAALGRRLALAGPVRLGAVVAVLVAARLALVPVSSIHGAGASAAWLWLDYGAPLLAFAATAHLLRREGRGEASPRLAWVFELAAAGCAFALLSFQIQQAFSPGRLLAWPSGLAHWGTLISAWLLFATGAWAAARRWSVDSLKVAGGMVGSLAVAALALGPCLLDNPLWRHLPVGETPIVNLLPFVYGVPALFFALLGRFLARRGAAGRAQLAGLAALGLAFLLLTLEVRQAFRGTFLDGAAAGSAERYAYSAAWLLFATALLVAGILRRRPALRYAALAVMTLSVGKVFLYDTAHLTGLYRVSSFFGLGLALMLLAWLYQRYVFRAKGEAPPAALP